MISVETVASFAPGVIREVHRWIAKGVSDKKSSEVIRRALCNELKFNLGLLNSVLPARGSSSSEPTVILIGALVVRLDNAVSEAIFAGVESELLVLQDLDSRVAAILDEAEPQDLAISRSITNASRVDFSTLLGFVIRKTAEMRALSAIQLEQGVASMPKIDWAKRIGNLRDVMLFLVSRMTADS